MQGKTKLFWQRGEPLVWMSGAALSVILLVMVVLLVVVVSSGLGVFWPHHLVQCELQDGSFLLGERIKEDVAPHDPNRKRIQFKIGNRDLYSIDFRWVDEVDIVRQSMPENAVVLERQEYGNFYGFIQMVGETTIAIWDSFERARKDLEPKRDQAERIQSKIRSLNRNLEALRQKSKKLRYKDATADDPRLQAIAKKKTGLDEQFNGYQVQLKEIEREINQVTVIMTDVNGTDVEMPIADIVRAYQPNRMNTTQKVAFYAGKIKELLFGEPRESNTEGGLFPAIFGTVMLVFLMSLLSFPLGVLTGIYLREYAKQGVLVQLVRIAVNNLAGIPSIVYGIFGLGFFVYGIGGSIDTLFFPERLPTPTFGTGGILWAGLTLGILTVPVVIVATEEAFGSIPRGIREASLALGATRFQTLTRVLLPMAIPGMMTGFILAMARAAGEVAPLMITGVVKLAPSLPMDGSFPFLHLDRKFMHLGFHIYDIGFQSPNVEAAKPMIFVTTLLLVLIVFIMSSSAIVLRNRMARKYAMQSF